MTSNKKKFIKSTAQMYTGIALLRMGKEMKRRRKQQEQVTVAAPQPQVEYSTYEYGLYESTIVRIVGALSSFVEVILKDGVEVDPYLMGEAQELLNDLQELMDIKKKLVESANNGA